MRRHNLAALMLLALLAAGAAHAGLVVESTSSVNGPQTLTVANDRVRIEPARAGAPAMLFDAGRGRLVLLNRPASQYNVITVERLDALEKRVTEQRERIRRSIEQTEGEDRRRLQRRLERLPRVDGPDAIRIERRGERTRINGFDCEQASATEAGERTHRLCISRVSDLGLTETTTATLRALFDFLARMRNLLGSGTAPFDARVLQATLGQTNAFPVRIERSVDGSNWTVRDIETADIPAERFEVPADFKEGARLGGE